MAKLGIRVTDVSLANAISSSIMPVAPVNLEWNSIRWLSDE